MILGPVRCQGCGRSVVWAIGTYRPEYSVNRWRDADTLRTHACGPRGRAKSRRIEGPA